MIKSVISPLCLVSILLLLSHYIRANETTWQYIEQYKTIAINEMQRVGIPASIKMAQAIVESNSGNSTLARQSNNHFGIKCGKNWNGPVVYREDDDYENGLLVESCFRAFSDPTESFIEHSDFLANPYSERYRSLFQLDIYDYEAWAVGLKRAGYATDPNYVKKLIDIIERYRLYELDLGVISMNELAMQEEETHYDEKHPRVIASNVGMTSSIKEKNSKDSKRRKSNKKNKRSYYKVKANDTMESIAMANSIEVKKLYFQNRMPFGVEPIVGAKIALDHYIHFRDVPEWRYQEAESKEGYLFEQSITIAAR